MSFLSIFSSNHSGTLFSSVWAISMALFVLLATILAMSGGENRTVKVNECDMDPQKKPWREGDYGPCYKDTGPNHKRLNCCCQKWSLKAEWNCEEKWDRHPKRVKCDLGNFSFQSKDVLLPWCHGSATYQCKGSSFICERKFDRRRRGRRV